MAPDNGVDFDTEFEEADVHTTNGMKMTRSGKPMICDICGKNHYTNMCPYMEEGSPNKKSYKADDTAKKESTPPKALVNVTIGKYWGDDTDYGGLMFFQVMAETASTKKTLKMERCKHMLIQSVGHIIPTWILLDNQSTANAFLNRRLLKIQIFDRELVMFSTGVQNTTNLKGDLPGYGTV